MTSVIRRVRGQWGTKAYGYKPMIYRHKPRIGLIIAGAKIAPSTFQPSIMRAWPVAKEGVGG
jgi:hypothetical protein